MKDQIIVTPGEQKNKQHFHRERLQRPFVNPFRKDSVAESPKRPNQLIFDWQLTDYKPAENPNMKESDLYVADWQMVDGNR